MYELPIFPLNTVLFPGMPLRLHIFEERYKAMLQHVMRTNQTFGVNLIRSGAEALGPLAVPYPTGCTARILDVERLEDGRANLTAVGDERFRILQPASADSYLKAVVESAPLLSHHTLDVVRGARALRRLLSEYLALLDRQTGPDAAPESKGEDLLDLNLATIPLPEDPMTLMYLSASMLQIPAAEKQPLLEADTAADLLKQVQRLLRRELAVLPSLLDISPEQARASAWVN